MDTFTKVRKANETLDKALDKWAEEMHNLAYGGILGTDIPTREEVEDNCETPLAIRYFALQERMKMALSCRNGIACLISEVH